MALFSMWEMKNMIVILKIDRNLVYEMDINITYSCPRLVRMGMTQAQKLKATVKEEATYN